MAAAVNAHQALDGVAGKFSAEVMNGKTVASLF